MRRSGFGYRSRFLGTAYRGTGDLEVAAAAITAACEATGMVCSRQDLAEGDVRIEADQQRRWVQILLENLPQGCVWRLTQFGAELRVSSDFRWSRWFQALILGLAGLLLLCFAGVVAASLDSSTFGWLGHFETELLLAAVLLILALSHLLLGGRHQEDIHQITFTKVRRAGGFLEPVGSGVSRRLVLTLGSLLGFVLALAAWVVGDTLYEGTFYMPRSLALFLTTLILLVFLLIAIAVLMIRSGGFNFRVAPLTTGVVSALCILLFLSPAPLWLGVGANIEIATLEAGEVFLLEEGFPEDWDEDARTDEVREHMRRHYSPFRTLCWQVLFSIAFLVVLGVAAVARFGVLHSITSARILRTYQKSRGLGVYREATRGGRFLHGFRVVFVISWLLFTAANLAVLTFLVLCAVQAMAPIFTAPELQLAGLSAAVVSFALGQPIGGETVEAAVRSVWVVHAAIGLALLIVSAGQLAVEEHRERRRLRRARRAPSEAQKELQEGIDHLAAEAELGTVHVVVSKGIAPAASSRVFGVWRQERFIEISALCVGRMRREDVVALLAHELAHHRLGHSRRYRLLRWLGRLSFVGDGFVLALQNSWAYEESADQTAVEELGVRRGVLAHALRNLRNMSDAWKLERRRRGGGPRAQPAGLEDVEALLAETGADRAPRRRWLHAWTLFRLQYFHAMELHYWYPPREERYLALESS